MLQKIADSTGERYEVILVPPTPRGSGPVREIAAAGGYHVLLRGWQGDAKYVETLDRVEVIKRGVDPWENLDEYLAAGMEDIALVVSNTTEAGIFYDPARAGKTPHNFPSLLALLLMRRAKAGLPPLSIMPLELNDRSADLLKKCLLLYGQSGEYGPADEFEKYLDRCAFYNTLVDRIVPGFPADAGARVGREDPYLTSGELFHLLVIEGDDRILELLPFGKAGLNVIVTPDRLNFYHDRKVRILNGAHTSSVPAALFAGLENVDAFASHPEHAKWLSDLMHGEICRALDDSEETHAYADEVLTRFKNPALGHSFRSIALNSVAKANARMRPTLTDYFKKEGILPPLMTGAVGKMCELYAQGAVAELPGGPLELRDFSQIRGPSLPDRLESFFPGLPAEIKGALLRELS